MPAEEPQTPIETVNDHMVGLMGNNITMLMPPLGPMPKETALRLAAWIVVIADPLGDRFDQILQAVKNT